MRPKAIARYLIAWCLALSSLPPALADGNEAVGAALGALLKSGEYETGSALAEAEMDRLMAFYAARGFKPIWARDDGPKGKARALFNELRISAVHGLSPEFYRVGQIEPLMASRQPAELARFDLLMTGALIEFGDDIANGRVGPAVAGSENAVAPVAFDPVSLLAGAEESGNLRAVVGGLLSTDFRYVRLIAKLAELEQIRKSGLWPQVGEGGEIAAGARDPRIPAIRRMLAINGDLAISLMAGSDQLDAPVSQALRVFQARHGIPETGQVDLVTLAELRVPVETRIRQVQVNLERRRWQNRDLGGDNLYVNLADSSLKLVRGGKSEWFGKLRQAGDLSTLPTFYGRIVAVDERPGEAEPLVLKVESPFVGEIGSAPGPGRLAVEQIGEIARQILAGNTDDDPTRKRGSARTLMLKTPVTLYVTYLTAWANRDGSLQLRPDRFDRDARLSELLELR